jgi:hypothetical protein
MLIVVGLTVMACVFLRAQPPVPAAGTAATAAAQVESVQPAQKTKARYFHYYPRQTLASNLVFMPPPLQQVRVYR